MEFLAKISSFTVRPLLHCQSISSLTPTFVYISCFSVTVDASDAGAGNLEVIVRSAKDGSRIPNFLDALDRSGRFRIYFTPKASCFRYKVDVMFNEKQIREQPLGLSPVMVIDGDKNVIAPEPR